MCALDAEVFNFMHSSCLIGFPCVRVRVHVWDRRYCQQQSTSALWKPSQSAGFWMWLKSLKSSCKMDGWGPERIRGRWEELRRIGSQGRRITLLKSGLKQLVPPGLFFTPFTTEERIFIICESVVIFFQSDLFLLFGFCTFFVFLCSS